MTNLRKVLEDIQSDGDLTPRAKFRLSQIAEDYGWQAAQQAHLTYLMGRTDVYTETLKGTLQGHKEAKRATEDNLD